MSLQETDSPRKTVTRPPPNSVLWEYHKLSSGPQFLCTPLQVLPNETAPLTEAAFKTHVTSSRGLLRTQNSSSGEFFCVWKSLTLQSPSINLIFSCNLWTLKCMQTYKPQVFLTGHPVWSQVVVNDFILEVDGGHILRMCHRHCQQDAHQEVDNLWAGGKCIKINQRLYVLS